MILTQNDRLKQVTKTVCRCTCRKSVPEGEAGGDESKGCWRRYRKAYATKGKGKRRSLIR